MAQADNLLAQVRDLQAKTWGILEKAEGAGRLGTAVMAIREARGNIELLAKLLGQIDERPQINILVNPQWLSVRAVLMDVLQDYPEARVAVAVSLRQLEGSQS